MKEEPIAWMSPDGKVSQTEGKLFHIPLYTKPQQWHMVNKDGYVKPLSDEEILSLQWMVHYASADELVDFARAIEERHGIK
jgi:hypothetical protein